MPMIYYRCPDCGTEEDHFHHSRSSAPASIACRGTRVSEQPRERIERKTTNPDGTVTIEYEEVELAPTLSLCTGTALQVETYPGQLYAAPAKRFEELVIYERLNYDKASDDFKRGHDRYYIPGRNNEPTEAGMKRIEITNIHQYNRVVKEINRFETEKMRDHRYMHEEYWKARRKAMREDVDARLGSNRAHPLIAYLRYAMRKRSDQKSAKRYGKPLDAHFHAQLIEFDQGKIQDWCAEDSGGRKGWQSRRAR